VPLFFSGRQPSCMLEAFGPTRLGAARPTEIAMFARSADTTLRVLCCGLCLASVAACTQRDLRGRVVPSADGRTYLVIDDPNASACDRIHIDGRPWTHPTGVAGRIAPGLHTLSCGGDIQFRIQPRTTFHFDYWGP
jgi:hypothetical protein